MAPWKLPLLVFGIVIPVAAAFLLGGPGVGVAVGALVAVAILVVAVRQRPRGPIYSARGDGHRHVLLVLTCPVEDPAAVQVLAREAGLSHDDGSDVLALAPARLGFLDRWASDVERARHDAQQRLVVTVAALAKAGIAAEARVGDEDVVQAVEDQLQSFPASEVVLVSPGDAASEAATELAGRLQAEFHHIVLGGR